MAEEILFATLDGNVPLQEVLTWISNETYGPSLQEHLKSSRGDFVLCILNYLRETTGRVWQLSSTFQSPIKSVKKSVKINHLNGQTSPEKSFQKRFARRVELFPTGATNSSNLLDDEKNVSTSKSEVDIIDDTSFANRTRSPNTYSPSPFKEAMGKCSVKQKEDENPFLVPEVSCLATSSPLSTSATSDSFPQHTPINRRVQGFKSNERCSTPVGTNSPDYHFKTPTRGNGMCLGDFLIKGGKSQQSKKRFTLSPTNSPVSSENSSPVDQPSNQSSKKKHKRRINPTKVCLETGPSSAQNGFQDLEAFGSTNRPIPDASPFKTVSMEPIKASLSFTEERNLLKQERLKLQNQGENLVSEATSANCALPTKSALPKMMTVADPLQVTNPDKLLKLCEMYSCVLNANLVPNLMSELYFLISLLVIRHDLSEDENESVTNLEEKMKHASIANLDEQDCNEIVHEPSSVDLSPVRSGKFSAKKPCHYQYFYTVHNCVFFATNVLSKQVDVLGNLDRITLKLLLDSERIAVFSPKLKQNLVSLYNNSVSSGKSSQGVLPNKAIVSNVSFQSDTDNSSNFPSAQCFSNFRKQRDGFYEILRIWEANHQKPGWNFAVTLGSRVRSLLHLCSDPINLMHFARLFRLQLVSIVSGAPNNFDDESQDLQFLEGLRGIDPDKLNRLKDRLVTPYKAGGPRPEPSFPGSQEFYRDFILSASHLSFLQHLQDSLISHLLELDQTSFLASDTEDSEFTVDSTTRQNYLSCVVMMRLLAKFLGLIVFLPYSRADVNLPQNIRETEVFVRSKVMPPLDILRCVVEAHKNHRLIVTIPWVVKFLGMMDSVSSSLPVYQTVIQLLLRLYMDLMRQGTCSSLFRKSVLLPSQTVLLLRLSLGWLFDASFIQETFFHSWCFNLDETLMLTLDAGGTPYFDASLPALDSSDGVSVTSSTAPPVDALNLIDCEVLYALCPFLLELRALLASTSSECAPGGSVRHITPVSAGSSMLPSASSSKQLELKLEDSFFHGLPASVFRTVEFVVERVTSSCVKHICNVWLPSLKQKGILQLQEKIKSYQTDIDSKKDSAEIQMELKKEISSIVDQVSTSLKAKCRTGVAEFCLSKCKGALFSLLSEESLSVPVCEMCVKIASRMSEERVISWMQNHATLTIYSKDLQSETEKAIKNRERCEVSNSTAKTSHIAPGATALWEHDDSAPSPIVVLQSLKIMVCDILSGQDTPRECVDDVLNQMEQCVTKRQDVVPAAERIFALLSVDLIVSLVCHNPCMVDSSLLSRMVGLWKLDALRPVEDGLARLVCPRNMLLLAQSGHQTRLVWEKLAEVVAAVLKADLVTPDLVENQCLAIMQQEWPQNILRCFAMCMNEVVRQYQKQKNVDYKFVLLLEWLAETMAQIDYFPHL